MSAILLRHREDIYPSRCSPEPRWLERRDQVVYSPHRSGGPLPPPQIEAYARDGFLVLEGLFDQRELAVLKAELERLREGVSQLDQELVITEPGGASLRSIFRAHEVSPLFGRLARDVRLVEAAEYLLGDRVYIHQSRLNYKPGFVGKEFYWHSDFETWHVEDGMPRMRALSISINLSDNSESNGPLMLIPGSHMFYVTCVGQTPENHYRASLRKQEYGVPDPDSLRRLAEQGRIRTVTGPAGTTALFDCNTMHGSNGNITPYPRSNVFIVYNSVSNAVEAPFGPDKPRPEFLAERNCFEPIAALSGPIRDVEADDSS